MAAVSSIIAATAVAASVGGTVAASKASKSASKTAANAATTAANQNNLLQRETYASNAARLDPYGQRGNEAGSAINALLGLGGGAGQPQPGQPQMASYAPETGFDGGYEMQARPESWQRGYGESGGQSFGQPASAPMPMQGAQSTPGAYQTAFDNFRNSTGYQFRQSEGLNALGQQFAGRGLYQSGANQKASMRYGQNLASAEFGNYLSQLQGQQQTGLAGASALAGVGQNMANAVGANNNSAASATGNAALANGYNTSNAIGQGVGALGNILGSSFGSGGFKGGGGFAVNPGITATNNAFLNRPFGGF